MRNLRRININNILFLDIETVPNWRTFAEAPENVRKEWVYKFKFRSEAPQPLKPETLANTNITDDLVKRREMEIEKYFAELWEKEAGLYPEFSRIVCISYGFMYDGVLRLKSAANVSERVILDTFVDDLGRFYDKNKNLILCAHNGKGFDFPFILKRLLFHRMEIPMVMDVYGLKPWEMVSFLDTLEIWKFGSQTGAGLPAIALHFGIPTPKDDIDGSDVSRVYYSEGLDRITIYCEKDVVTLANVLKCMRGEDILRDGQVQKIGL